MRTSARTAIPFCLLAAAAQADPPRDFNSDTPGRTLTPYTVAETYFQLESDAIHLIGTGSTQTIQALDPVLKYGLTNSLDIELLTTGLLNTPVTNNNRTTRATGYGDVTPTVKYNLFGNDRQDFAAAIVAGVKIPTATRGFGNGQVDYTSILTTQAALPLNLSLQIQQEIDLLRNQSTNGHHANFAEAVALGRAFGKFTLSVDAYADSGTDHQAPAYYTADVGLSYALTAASLVAFGAYAGLNRAAPPIETYLSFAFRF